jgi:DNA-binding Lrp family transcriptional regulator
MDERDLEIIWTIAELGTGNVEKLERVTDIPRSTISYRINNLRDAGVFTTDTFDIDSKKTGLRIVVISEFFVDIRKHTIDSIGKTVAEIEGVNQIYYTMGETDFVTVAYLPTRESIQRLMEDYGALNGVIRTNSKYVVNTYKNNPNPITDYSLDSVLQNASFGD